MLRPIKGQLDFLSGLLFEGVGFLVHNMFSHFFCLRLAVVVSNMCCSQMTIPHLSSEKNPGYLLYIGDYTTQLYGDYFINHEIRIPTNQPVFHGK